MDGGVDALSLLAPVGDSRYAALRPTLALSPEDGTAFSEDPGLRWHPSASGLATLHSEGKVSVFPAIGYDSPNQSHFTSRHFYEIGEVEVGFRTGWMGRYLDLRGDDENPLQGLSLDGELSPTLATASKPVAAVDSVTNYDLWARVDRPVSDEMFRSFARFGSFPSDSGAMKQARQATSRTETLREQLAQFDGFTSPVTYPDSYFAEGLSGLAAMIAVGFPLHCVTISAAGTYDTHSDQAPGFGDDLRQTCDAILAFQRDLEARGLADRVLVEVWSEFGRRPEENGSRTPTTAPPAAPSWSARRRRARWSASSRASPRSTTTTTSATPATSAPCTARCSSSGWDRTRRRSSRGRRSFARPALVKA